MKVKNESEVAQSCLTLSDPMDCSPPDSSIHGIFQARVLEWVAIPFSKGPHPETEPCSPAWRADSLPTELPGKPIFRVTLGNAAFIQSQEIQKKALRQSLK